VPKTVPERNVYSPERLLRPCNADGLACAGDVLDQRRLAELVRLGYSFAVRPKLESKILGTVRRSSALIEFWRSGSKWRLIR